LAQVSSSCLVFHAMSQYLERFGANPLDDRDRFGASHFGGTDRERFGARPLDGANRERFGASHFGGTDRERFGASPLDSTNRNVNEVRKMAFDMDEIERDLWKNCSRFREFVNRGAHQRSQFSGCLQKRISASAFLAEGVATLEHLTREMDAAMEQEMELEHDIAVLKESNRLLHGNFCARQMRSSLDVASASPKELLVEERARMVSVRHQHEQIAHLRSHLEKIHHEREGLQQRQRVLFEKHHAAEQDRNLLLGAMHEDSIDEEFNSVNSLQQRLYYLLSAFRVIFSS